MISFIFMQKLKDLLLWIKEDLGPWGPLALILVYIPLTILAVPASVLTLGGGYLFGLPVGFIADTIGATLGATAAFLVGRTVGRPFIISKLKNYPKFQAVNIAVERSGFKIVLLLRLVPLLPFNVLNYLLSVTPVHVGDFVLASMLGVMPITFALVYVGTTLKDLSAITHGWHEASKMRWVFMLIGFAISGALFFLIIRIARTSLEKALAENGGLEPTTMLPIISDTSSPSSSSSQPLVITIDPAGAR
ncbi:TVP38/TMEM64 family membrane protein slr0305 [Linum perenne]